MSTTTTNLKLIKPELTDAADITATNENWDKIDEQLSKTYTQDNKPTPADIGAVKKSGDTMTGHLTLSVPNYTQIMLDNTGTGSRVKIQNGGHYAFIGMQDASTESNQRQIFIRDKTNRDGLKESLQLADIVNGSTTYYNIYGEHNPPPLPYTYGTEDIEAGSASTAATGTLHFVYE